MAEQRLTDLLPAPYSGSTRQIGEFVTMSGTTAAYKTFADATATALVRKDYLATYVAGAGVYKVDSATGNINPTLGTNYAFGTYTAVLGGNNNSARGTNSVAGGGSGNNLDSQYGGTFSGLNNNNNGDYTFVGTGRSQRVFGGVTYSFIGTGTQNLMSGSNSAIVAGFKNSIAPDYGFISNGENNTISDFSPYGTMINCSGSTIGQYSANVTLINCKNFSAPAYGPNVVYVNNALAEIGRFTPANIKNGVTASGNTWTSGELQAATPVGSYPGMQFCDASYRYQYMNGMKDTDGTSYAWVRLLKAMPG